MCLNKYGVSWFWLTYRNQLKSVIHQPTVSRLATNLALILTLYSLMLHKSNCSKTSMRISGKNIYLRDMQVYKSFWEQVYIVHHHVHCQTCHPLSTLSTMLVVVCNFGGRNDDDGCWCWHWRWYGGSSLIRKRTNVQIIFHGVGGGRDRGGDVVFCGGLIVVQLWGFIEVVVVTVSSVVAELAVSTRLIVLEVVMELGLWWRCGVWWGSRHVEPLPLSLVVAAVVDMVDGPMVLVVVALWWWW